MFIERYTYKQEKDQKEESFVYVDEDVKEDVYKDMEMRWSVYIRNENIWNCWWKGVDMYMLYICCIMLLSWQENIPFRLFGRRVRYKCVYSWRTYSIEMFSIIQWGWSGIHSYLFHIQYNTLLSCFLKKMNKF